MTMLKNIQKNLITQKISDADVIYRKFKKLPIKQRLIVYAKIMHGNSFKAYNNDLFGINRRNVVNTYRNFINDLKDEFDVTKKNNKTQNKRKEKSKKASPKEKRKTRKRENRRY